MKKKVVVISVITGIFILGLCIKLTVGSRNVPVINNAATEGSIVADGANEQSGQEKTEPEESEDIQSESEKPEELESEEMQAVQVTDRQNKILHAEKVNITEPIVELNGEKGMLNLGWTYYCYDCIRVDADTLLFASDCYFADEKLQQKIFFLAEAPDFNLREVFRQDSKIWDKELRWPESLECRMMRPYSVDGGYVYELDGVLYFLDGDFKKASQLWDLRELMGDYYSFSVGLYYRTCDVTEDAARLIACTDGGLYEYDLKNGSRKLLESAYYAPHDIDEEDCLCGQRSFRFVGPVMVEYGPDEQSYAFLTGTEEASWGDITGIVLCSGEGETTYQKESDYVYDFKWAESEDAIYLAVFYTEKEENGIVDAAWLMDRVNVNTGEVETFEVPKEMYLGSMMGCAVGFLDADTILYDSYNLQRFTVYRLSSGERQLIEASEDVDWEMMVFDLYDFGTVPVRYPKHSEVDIKYNESDSDPMEVYERFLNGKLSVELKDEQVTISNLFWDNDIKYCYLDIDGDGIDELHIKDNVRYYAIKAVDGAPQILFKGGWYYEPVATDELSGILYIYNGGYGSEYIEFIQISPDGSTESDGEIHWFDKNEDGNMDAEDSFDIYIGYDDSLEKYVGYEDIDMEQYIQYKNEHSAQQAGYELEWTDRRLNEFVTWQEAYIDFLKKPSDTIWVSGSEWEDYSLIYIDDDNVPELYINTGGAATGETIVSFYEGKVRAMNRDRGGIKYMEYGGLLYSDWGSMGYYPCDIYMLESGEFSEIGTGWISDHYDEETASVYFTYYWEGKEVTETEYEECINKMIDKSKCIEPSELYSRDEMLEILK